MFTRKINARSNVTMKDFNWHYIKFSDLNYLHTWKFLQFISLHSIDVKYESKWISQRRNISFDFENKTNRTARLENTVLMAQNSANRGHVTENIASFELYDCMILWSDGNAHGWWSRLSWLWDLVHIKLFEDAQNEYFWTMDYFEV